MFVVAQAENVGGVAIDDAEPIHDQVVVAGGDAAGGSAGDELDSLAVEQVSGLDEKVDYEFAVDKRELAQVECFAENVFVV